jgi:tetratricopeptide (TPR) repeat protein
VTRSRRTIDDRPPSGRPPSRYHRLLPLIVIVAGILAYHSSFSGEFVLDDVRHIVENRRLHDPAQLWAIVAHSRRPAVDLTFAANHAADGLNVAGYHAVNLAVHLLTAVALYALVRLTLLSERLAARFGASASWLALATSLIWVVHPLATQSVTYVIQRCESMMGLFYLLTIYCAARGAASSGPRKWSVLAVGCCAVGMASKAVMVTAPLMVLVYDRVFTAESVRQALRRRWGMYVGLAATWGILAACGVLKGVLFPGDAPGTVGFGTEEVTPSEYLATQPSVLVHYLRLALWPDPLCLDYAWPIARTAGEIVLPGLLVVALLGATLLALKWSPGLGFLGAWFFVILAPTSSFIPIRDLAFEHRMYLPLMAVVLLVVFVGARVLRLAARRLSLGNGLSTALAAGLVVAVAAAGTWGTIRRNRVYHSQQAMWTDVLKQSPDNARAHISLGVALAADGRAAEASEHYQAAVRITPNYHIAHLNLGNAKARQGDYEGAIPHYAETVRLKPSHTGAHLAWAVCLDKIGRLAEAIDRFKSALQTRPPGTKSDAVVTAHFRLADAFARAGDLEGAVREYRQGLDLRPGDYAARYNLGNLLSRQGEFEQAAEQYRRALEAKPDHVRSHYNLGRALYRLGKIDEAEQEFRETLRLKPDHARAAEFLATIEADRR